MCISLILVFLEASGSRGRSSGDQRGLAPQDGVITAMRSAELGRLRWPGSARLCKGSVVWGLSLSGAFPGSTGEPRRLQGQPLAPFLPQWGPHPLAALGDMVGGEELEPNIQTSLPRPSTISVFFC